MPRRKIEAVLQHRQPGRIKSVLLLALGMVLLLSLIAPQAVSHLPFLCVTLIPLFLFAALVTIPLSPRPVVPSASCAASQTARPALFQIPPPSASA